MKLTYIHSHHLEQHHLAVYEYGKPSDAAVVLLHGFTHNALFFKPLAEFLSSRGLYVICPDMPGRGESQYLQNSRNYNYHLYIDDLFLILGFLKIHKTCLFGSSMGGFISVLFTEKFPKNINKIILNDIGVVAPSAESMRIGKYVGNDFFRKTRGEMIKRIDEELLQSNLSNEELNFIFDIYTLEKEEGYIFNYDRKLRDAFWFKEKQIKIPDLDLGENFGHLARSCKALELYVIRGAKSNLLNVENFQRLKDCRQYKDSMEIAGKGHMPLFFSDPEKETILRWITA